MKAKLETKLVFDERKQQTCWACKGKMHRGCLARKILKVTFDAGDINEKIVCLTCCCEKERWNSQLLARRLEPVTALV